MAISKKPVKAAISQSIDVNTLINKGGSIAGPQTGDAVEKQVSLRIPQVMLVDIEKIINERTIRIPRHTWILNAMAEKIEREKN